MLLLRIPVGCYFQQCAPETKVLDSSMHAPDS